MEFESWVPAELRQQIEDGFARLDEFGRRLKELDKLFADRDKNCNSLGFPDYEVYKKSSLWKRLRSSTLKRDNKVCVRCGGPVNQVHHRSYSLEVLRGNEPEKLASVCAGCHNIIHFNEYEAYRFQDEWEAILMVKDERTDFPRVDIDRRRRLKQLRPPEWKRMTAVQRAGWEKEYDRQFGLGCAPSKAARRKSGILAG